MIIALIAFVQYRILDFLCFNLHCVGFSLYLHLVLVRCKLFFYLVSWLFLFNFLLQILMKMFMLFLLSILFYTFASFEFGWAYLAANLYEINNNNAWLWIWPIWWIINYLKVIFFLSNFCFSANVSWILKEITATHVILR